MVAWSRFLVSGDNRKSVHGASALFYFFTRSRSSRARFFDRPYWLIAWIRLIIWQGKSEHSDRSFLIQDFAIQTVSVESVMTCVFFAFESRQTQNKHGPSAYNKLLTNLASLSRTGEYCHDLRPIFHSTALELT